MKTTHEGLNEGESSIQELSCYHNGFVHRVFPRVALTGGQEVVDMLTENQESSADYLSWVFSLVDSIYPQSDEHALLFMKDIDVTVEYVDTERLVVIALTPATESMGTHFIGLLMKPTPHPDEECPFRYLTFECDGSPDDSAVVCEWAYQGPDELVHRNLGLRGAAGKEAFLECIGSLRLLGY